LQNAFDLAALQEAIVLFGVHPSADLLLWKSFGCIKARADGQIVDFEEKPDERRAQQMIGEGSWTWNSGMFVFRLNVAEALLQILAPAMFATYEAMARALGDGDIP